MKMNRPWRQLLTVLCLTLGGLGGAAADEHAARVPLSPLYQQECAACHLAYPPGMLPAASWQRLMNNLPHHFGSDASLDPASVKTLAAWLSSHAGESRRTRTPPPEDRITKSAWFVHEHDEIDPAVWRRASVRSASNCVACHRQADRGLFDEDNVRIPR